MRRFTQSEIDDLNSKNKNYRRGIQWVSENLHPKVAKASSFGAEDAVVMDIDVKN